MGRKRTPGLVQRDGIWHIDKRVRGSRLCESTGTSDLSEAETYLARRIEEVRQARVYGVRPERTFREAATKYLEDAMREGELRSLDRNAQALRLLDPYIGDLPVHQVHMDTLDPYLRARKAQGIKNGTLGRDLAVVRRVLNLAARVWRAEHGLTWLETPPLIQLPKATDARKPYPLAWEEQALLFRLLPAHLQRMALFKVNTGCREQEVCNLRLGLGGASARAGDLGISHPDGPGEERRGSPGGAQPRGGLRGGGAAGQTPGVCVHLPRVSGHQDVQQCLEAGTSAYPGAPPAGGRGIV